MTFIRRAFPLILLMGVALACTLPASVATPSVTEVPPPPTLFVPPSPTHTLEPTPVPTPIPTTRIATADLAFFYGDWDAALMEYTAALESSPDADVRTAALLGIGRTRYQMGNYPEALDALRELVTSSQSSLHLPAAQFTLAQIYKALYRYEEAAEAYEAYLTLRPGVIDAYINEWLADVLLAAGDYLDAVEVYQEAMVAPRLGETFDIEMKIGQAYAAMGDHPTALVIYSDIYTRTTNDYLKAQADFLTGQSYTALGEYDLANAAYLDAVGKYPLSYDTYQGLILLVNAGYPVSEFDRGLVDYYAGQYSLAIAAFDRYLSGIGDQSATALYYKGLAYRALDDQESAINAWDQIIQTYPDDEYLDDAWEQIAYTQWAYLDQYEFAIQSLLGFVDGYAWHNRAAEFLFDAAWITERAGDMEGAATLWERVVAEYPTSEYVSRSLFLAGIARYRDGKFASALETFKRFQGNSAILGDRAAALFWIGKTYQISGDEPAALQAWEQAASIDPTGYYSERARDLLLGRSPFTPPQVYDLGFDIQAEKNEAEAWMRMAFAIPDERDISTPGALLGNPRLVRGTELWHLGMYDEARLEFESLRAEINQDPIATYHLANYLLDLGLYRSAIFAARQVLTLAGMDDAATMNAPPYFNHIRFGIYYPELILPVAEAYDFHPLFLFCVVRQESLFEGFVRSTAGARGLMQIIPSTGQSIADNAGWPLGYTSEDLYRPKVSVTFGADYLDQQRDYFDDDMYAALAAYNGGPGNSAVWKELAGDDPDLFLEVIRFDETRKYIKGIFEVFAIYRRLYDRTP